MLIKWRNKLINPEKIIQVYITRLLKNDKERDPHTDEDKYSGVMNIYLVGKKYPMECRYDWYDEAVEAMDTFLELVNASCAEFARRGEPERIFVGVSDTHTFGAR